MGKRDLEKNIEITDVALQGKRVKGNQQNLMSTEFCTTCVRKLKYFIHRICKYI
jgi:hypothetical protein